MNFKGGVFHGNMAGNGAGRYGKACFCHDSSSGLQAIIAIHNTTLGPALGGCRYWAYTSKEEAIRDAIKLAKGMTYKNAMAGLPYGGGKAVVWDVTGASEQMTTGERVGGGVVDSLQSAIFDSLLIDSNKSDMLGGTLIESVKGDTFGKGLEHSAKDNVLGKMLANSGMDEAGEANNGIIAENSEDETQTRAQAQAQAQDKVWMDTTKDGSFSRTQADSSVNGTFGEGLADPAKNKEIRASQFRALGRFLERLQGRFVTGLDLGTTAADMDQIRVETAYVTDTTGSLGAQDDFTADMTAYGVYIGIVTSAPPGRSRSAGHSRCRPGTGQGRACPVPLPACGRGTADRGRRCTGTCTTRPCAVQRRHPGRSGPYSRR